MRIYHDARSSECQKCTPEVGICKLGGKYPPPPPAYRSYTPTSSKIYFNIFLLVTLRARKPWNFAIKMLSALLYLPNSCYVFELSNFPFKHLSIMVQGSFLGLKWPGREVHHLSPYSAEINNWWRYTSTPPTRLHGVGAVNFTFYNTVWRTLYTKLLST